MSFLAVLGIAFVAGFAMDLVWTLCVDAVTRCRPLVAANLSAVLYLCTIVSTVLIVEKCFTAVAAYILGGWLGTYTVVTRRRKLNYSEPMQQ
jgi:hypothetical protein